VTINRTERDQMVESRAVAHLPGLEIELRHKKAPGEHAEYLAVTLKATPDIDAVAAWLTPMRMAQAMLAMNPFLAWAASANPFVAAMLRPERPAPRSILAPSPPRPAGERPRAGTNGRAHLH